MKILLDLAWRLQQPAVTAFASSNPGNLRSLASITRGILGPIGHRWASDGGSLRQRTIEALNRNLNGRTHGEEASASHVSEHSEPSPSRERPGVDQIRPARAQGRRHDEGTVQGAGQGSWDLEQDRAADEGAASSQARSEGIPERPAFGPQRSMLEHNRPMTFSGESTGADQEWRPVGLLTSLTGRGLRSGSIMLTVGGEGAASSARREVYVDSPEQAAALREALSEGHFRGETLELTCCEWGSRKMIQELENLFTHAAVVGCGISPGSFIMDFSLHKALAEHRIDKILARIGDDRS